MICLSVHLSIHTATVNDMIMMNDKDKCVKMKKCDVQMGADIRTYRYDTHTDIVCKCNTHGIVYEFLVYTNGSSI